MEMNKVTTTKHSPFYANYGYEPKTYGNEQSNHDQLSEKALERATRINEIHKEVQKNLASRAETMKTQANKKRIEGPTFKKGDKVYISRKNFKTKKPSNKLDELRSGPFEVITQTGPVNYKIKLPANMRMHPNFHVSLLEKAPDSVPLSKGIETDKEEFEVENVTRKTHGNLSNT